jgi:hypothetical protein
VSVRIVFAIGPGPSRELEERQEGDDESYESTGSTHRQSHCRMRRRPVQAELCQNVAHTCR